MFQPQLREYNDLPLANPSVPKQNTYDELVLDLSCFDHPGTNRLLREYSFRDLQPAFQNQSHSMNAKLMVVSLATGRTSSRQGRGYALFKEVEGWEMRKRHEEVMNKLNLDMPLPKQMERLDSAQQEALTTIPKFYGADKLIFKDKQHFWHSLFVFVFCLLTLLAHVIQSGELLNTTTRGLLFAAGIVEWTLLEYYFHRFDLHGELISGKLMNSHRIHHAFPSFPTKLALSWHKILGNELAFYLVYRYVLRLDHFDSLHLLLGLHIAIIAYDCLHYYFHFGPQLGIGVLQDLKKNHMKHHFKDSNRGFGVTNTLWDHVFGTQHLL